MSVTGILWRYIARQFLLWFFSLLLILIGTISLFEFIEMVRRAASRPEATLGVAFQLTLLKMPQTMELLFHFAVLFSAMFTFWRLTRSQELVVVRSAGMSAWQFLMPVVTVALLIGAFKIAALNPISAAMYSRFIDMENRYLRGEENMLQIGSEGLWLRQRDENGVAVIHADRTAPDAIVLESVTIYLFDLDERYVGRVDAPSAALARGYWDIPDARVQNGNEQATLVPEYRLPTPLTAESIQDIAAVPQALSFWDLPRFIDTLEATGFSPLRHRLHYSAMLAQPVLLAAMVLFAATFSLRHTRRGGSLVMIGAGVLTGFILFVLNDVMLALGLAETIPVAMAAWLPTGISLLIGTSLVLHLEDG